MLSTLFRPKWQHKDPQVRQQSIATLQTGKDNATLLTIAVNDPAPQVRHAAIQKLESLDVLRQLHDQTHHASDKHIIQQSWCSILGNTDITPPLQAENLILDCNDPHWLAIIACYCSNPSLQELAMTGLRDEATIFRLLSDNHHNRLWPTLIQQLHNEEALKQAASIVKGRDKKTTQAIRQKLDALQQQQLQEHQQQQQVQQILDKLQQLLASEHTPLMEGILLSLQQQFQALPHMPDQQQVIEAALQQCQARLVQQQQAEARQQQEQTLLADARQWLQQLTTSLHCDEAGEQQLQQLQSQQDSYPQLRPVLLEIRQLMHAITALNQQQSINAPLTTAAIGRLDAAQLSSYLQDVSKAMVLCQRHPVLKTRYLAGLQQQEALLKQQIKQQNQQQKSTQQQIDSLIDQADNAIAASDFATVQHLSQNLRTLSGQLDNEQRRAIQPALQRIQAATQALHDWKDFATDPKREALCSAMEKLIETDLPAPEKASQIKQLQAQWKALGYCKDQAAWQHFRTLSEQAYAPCKQYFDQQKQTKAFNAEQRTIICEQLEQFVSNLDWNHCDYRSIDKLYRAIDTEWQKYALLEQKQYKTLQQRYTAVMQQIKQKLHAEKQRNTDILQSIVQQAQQLTEQTDIQAALTHYQQLHEQWKNTGISFRKTQQELWQQLRAAGDQLYQARNQQRNDAEEVLQNNLQLAQQIIQQLADCRQHSDAEALKQQFEQLGSLPKNSIKKIRNDFQQALKKAQQQQQAQQQRAFYQQLASVKRWAEQCLAQEQNGETASIALPAEWPAGWQPILGQRFDNSSHIGEADARNLCIELEMLTEQASPDEDAALRRALHMQQLAEHFGNAARSNFAERFTDIYLRWSALPGGRISNYAPLAMRFYRIADNVIAGD